MDTAYAKTESAMYTSELDDCIIEFLYMIAFILFSTCTKFHLTLIIAFYTLIMKFLWVPCLTIFTNDETTRKKNSAHCEKFHDDLGWPQSFCKLRRHVRSDAVDADNSIPNFSRSNINSQECQSVSSPLPDSQLKLRKGLPYGVAGDCGG